MNLQDKLIELAPYNVGCKIMDGYFLITIVFKPKWTIIDVEDPKIECGLQGDTYCYCAPVEGDYIDKVFEVIDETIQYNLDLQKKVELFQAKIKELQQIFAEQDLETLETIEFTFKKPKRKYVKTTKKDKKKVEQSVLEEKDEDTDTENNSNDDEQEIVDAVNPQVYEEDIEYHEYDGEEEEVVKPMEIIER